MPPNLRCRLAMALVPLRRSRLALAGALLLFLVSLDALLLVASSPDAAAVPLVGLTQEVAVSAGTGHVYLPLVATYAVAALDARSPRLLAAVALPDGFLGAAAVNPVTEHVYVATLRDSLAVVSGATNTVLGAVPLTAVPIGIAVSSSPNRVYVTTRDSDHLTTAGVLVVLDGNRDTVLARVTVGVAPLGVALNPVTNRVYVANTGSDTVSVIDARTYQTIATVPVGYSPRYVGANARTNRVYVSYQGSQSLSVLDGSSNAVMGGIAIQGEPGEVVVNEATNRVYVTGTSPGLVTVLDGARDRVLTSLKLGPAPWGLAVDPARNVVYVTDELDNSVWAIQEHRFGLPTAHLLARSTTHPQSSTAPSASCHCDEPGSIP